MKSSKTLTDKKNFRISLKTESERVAYCQHFSVYGTGFCVYRRNSIDIAKSYVSGLLRCEKNHTNMERMVEKDGKEDYHRYYHFLSESKWDWQAVNRQTAQSAFDLFQKQKELNNLPVGLIIDESSHLKKGKESVGVARQYAGQIGKVDNCQVAVYSSLCNGGYTTLIGASLFLPESWTSDKARLDKAHVPSLYRHYKSKPELALSLIEEAVEAGVCFDWIGGDGLYGHNSELTRSLDKKGLFYVLDVHKDEHIYLSEPRIFLPDKKQGRGRTPSRFQVEGESTILEKYRLGLQHADWETVKVRKTAKGSKKVKVHVCSLWHWNGQEQQACRRTLVITVDEKSKRVKYSFSNGTLEEHTVKEYAYYQCNRYWVERCFDDRKNEIGLSGYQVRGWLAWHHHVSLVLVAALFLLKRRIANALDYPLMSVRDARILTIAHLFCDEQTIDAAYENMRKRHEKRQRDIDRYFLLENRTGNESECYENFKV